MASMYLAVAILIMAAWSSPVSSQAQLSVSYYANTCPSVFETSAESLAWAHLAPLDPESPNRFENNYFQALMNRRGLLQSDQALFSGGSTDSVVRTYSENAATFSTDFANAMVQMGNLGPLTGTRGEIRVNCARVN